MPTSQHVQPEPRGWNVRTTAYSKLGCCYVAVGGASIMASSSSSIAHPSSLDAFYELLAQTAPRLLVVDFFAEWCGPCKRVAPQFAELAARHQRVARFAKVDVDAAPDLAQNAGVRAMPTFHIYKAGERVFELKGADIGKLEAAVLQWSTDVGAALEAAEAPPLPQVALLHFDEGRLDKILPRLLQFDHELRQTYDDQVRAERTRENRGPLHTVWAHTTGGAPAPTALPARTQALSETESSTLASAVAAMQEGGGWPPSQLRLFERLLRWPPSYLYPVLDALRLAVLVPEVAAQIATEAPQEGSSASLVGLLALRPLSGVEHPAGPPPAKTRTHNQEVNQMLGLRFWCNLLAHAPAAQLAALVPAALEAAAQADCHECRRPATRLALSTLLLDLAVLLQRQRAGPDDKTMLVCALQQLLTTSQPDAEVRAARAARRATHPATPPHAPKCCRPRAQPDAPRSPPAAGALTGAARAGHAAPGRPCHRTPLHRPRPYERGGAAQGRTRRNEQGARTCRQGALPP